MSDGLSGRLLAALREGGVEAADLDPDAPLVSSGRVDSLGLFQLILWIESEIGRPVDAPSLSLGQQLDSIRDILAWVRTQRDGGG